MDPDIMVTEPDELRLGLGSLAEFVQFMDRNPWARDPASRALVSDYAVANGVVSSFLGTVPANEVAMIGSSQREGLIARGFNARQRTLLDAIAAEERARTEYQRILCLEGVTNFALAMKGRYPFCHATEYIPSVELQQQFYPVPHLDATKMDLPDASFDICVSNDVLEHVPDIDLALSETARILKPGGVMLATFPFAGGQEVGLLRARIENGALVHLMEPEFHGDPVRGEGVLVFECPGWDIVPRAVKAGFSEAKMVLTYSKSAGIAAGDFAFILHLEARR